MCEELRKIGTKPKLPHENAFALLTFFQAQCLNHTGNQTDLGISELINNNDTFK